MSVDPQYIKMIKFKKNVLPFSLILCLIIVDDTYGIAANLVIRDCITSIAHSKIFINTKTAAACFGSLNLIYATAKLNPAAIKNINNSNCAIRRYVAYLRSYNLYHVRILEPKRWCLESEKRCMEPLRLLRFESDIYPSPQIREKSKKDYVAYKALNGEVLDEETFLKRSIRLDNIDAAKYANIGALKLEVRENIEGYITYAKEFKIKDADDLESIDSYCIKNCIGQVNAVGYSNISLTNGENNKIIDNGKFKGCAKVFADAKKLKGKLEFKEKKLEDWCINKCI